MEALQRERAEIDRIDGELARLFEERMAAAARIGAEKRAQGLPIRDPAREEQVLARNLRHVGDPALRPHFARLLETLMAESRAWQGEEPPARQAIPRSPALPPVLLRRGALGEAGTVLPPQRRVFLVTDDGIPPSCVGTLAGQCRSCVVYSVPQGESSKSPERLTELLSAMLAAGLTRSDCVAALGGGVVCDLAGLAAGLYMRGIDCYYFPSTLLAMVDAALGGKTAINLEGVKNAVGLFRQPRAVVIDPELLETLPPRQLSNGLAEAVKMALTHDAALFARFEDPAGYGDVEEIIAACLRIKSAVVAADQQEAGLRRVLNFGHTLGHGLEAAAEVELLHGECVALGMLPMCAPPLRERLRAVLERLELPTYVNFNEIDPERVMAAVVHDKKAGPEGCIESVFVPEPGRFEFCRRAPEELRALLLTLGKGN